MKPVRESGAGFIALAVGGVLALNYPLLSLFDRSASVFGIPLPFLHLFVVWALLIAGIAVLAERRSKDDTDERAGSRTDRNGGAPDSSARPRPN